MGGNSMPYRLSVTNRKWWLFCWGRIPGEADGTIGGSTSTFVHVESQPEDLETAERSPLESQSRMSNYEFLQSLSSSTGACSPGAELEANEGFCDSSKCALWSRQTLGRAVVATPMAPCLISFCSQTRSNIRLVVREPYTLPRMWRYPRYERERD